MHFLRLILICWMAGLPVYVVHRDALLQRHQCPSNVSTTLMHPQVKCPALGEVRNPVASFFVILIIGCWHWVTLMYLIRANCTL